MFNSEDIEEDFAFDHYLLNRREFMISASGLALSQAIPLNIEYSEQLSPINNMAMIDFVSSSTANYIVENPANDTDTLLRLFGEEYKPYTNIIRVLGNNRISDVLLATGYQANLLAAQWNNIEKIHKLREYLINFIDEHESEVLLIGLLKNFSTHGNGVISVHNKILANFNKTSRPYAIPIQQAIAQADLNYVDNIGNKGCRIFISADPLINELAFYPNQKVVNISFQLGELTMVGEKFRMIGSDLIEVNQDSVIPVFKIDGVYKGALAEKNLRELFKLANAYPDKLFICAAGNYSDDFLEIRKQLETTNEWPKNILLTAQWLHKKSADPNLADYDKPRSNVYGADIYLDSTELSIEWGSSLTSAAISAWANILVDIGFTTTEVKTILLKNCDRVSINTNNLESRDGLICNVLNYKKLTRFIAKYYQ